MRETLSFSRIDKGFRRREAITEILHLDSEITVEREPEGAFTIRRRELSLELSPPPVLSQIGLSAQEARWLVEELTRAPDVAGSGHQNASGAPEPSAPRAEATRTDSSSAHSQMSDQFVDPDEAYTLARARREIAEAERLELINAATRRSLDATAPLKPASPCSELALFVDRFTVESKAEHLSISVTGEDVDRTGRLTLIVRADHVPRLAQALLAAYDNLPRGKR